MKNLKSLITCVLLYTCVMTLTFCTSNDERDEKRFVYDIDMRIVSINNSSSLTDDKFHEPQLCNTVLFETIKGEKLYREVVVCGTNGHGYKHQNREASIEGVTYHKINITTEWLYNHKPGDTCHFEYLRKDQFFRIKDRK